MIKREKHHLVIDNSPVSPESKSLEKSGYCIIRNVFPEDEIGSLKKEIEAVYKRVKPRKRPRQMKQSTGEMYRYQMFNHSRLCQKAIANKTILNVIEPLLGGDCHVIANTAWRNPAENSHAPRGKEWHIDAGPHVPRPEGVAWPEDIPYPIFVIGTHIYLEDCKLEDGPTAVVPGSHMSGCKPPEDKKWDIDLTYSGAAPVVMTAKAGDVSMFVSDAWHRRMPPLEGNTGRFFLQVNYGRRDIAQRVKTTSEVNHASYFACLRAKTERERQLIGLHKQHYYDG